MTMRWQHTYMEPHPAILFGSESSPGIGPPLESMRHRTAFGCQCRMLWQEPMPIENSHNFQWILFSEYIICSSSTSCWALETMRLQVEWILGLGGCKICNICSQWAWVLSFIPWPMGISFLGVKNSPNSQQWLFIIWGFPQESYRTLIWKVIDWVDINVLSACERLYETSYEVSWQF